MMMKRTHVLRIAVVVAAGLALLLAACGTGEMVKSAHTAAGDGTRPSDLTRTQTFRHDDDLNVVIMLNSHRRELEVSAVFNAPAGGTYATDTLEADENVGEVVLGLDWEAQNGEPWAAGEWNVEVLVDGDVEETLTFTVTPPPDEAGAEG